MSHPVKEYKGLEKDLYNKDTFVSVEGFMFIEKDFSGHAISDLTKAIILKPEYAEAYYNRGGAYSDMDQFDKAISDLNKAIEINPEFVEAYINRGNTYARKSQYEQSTTDQSKTIEVTPKHKKSFISNDSIMLGSENHATDAKRELLYDYKDSREKACADWEWACELGDCKIYKIAKDEGYCK